MSQVSTSIKTLDCYDRTVGGVLYLRDDLSVVCGQGKHVGAVLAAVVWGLGVVGVGFPLAVFCILRPKASCSRAADWLEFMSVGYDRRRGMQWWESLVLLRKTALVATAALLSDAATQIAAVQLIVVPALVVHVHMSPFRAASFNFLEGLSLSCIVFTAAVSNLYLHASNGAEAANGLAAEAPPPAAMEAAITLVLIGANAAVGGVLAAAVVLARIGRPVTCNACSTRERQATKVSCAPAIRAGAVTKPSPLSTSVTDLARRIALPPAEDRGLGHTSKVTSSHSQLVEALRGRSR
jgi:hypothetical protein